MLRSASAAGSRQYVRPALACFLLKTSTGALARWERTCKVALGAVEPIVDERGRQFGLQGGESGSERTDRAADVKARAEHVESDGNAAFSHVESQTNSASSTQIREQYSSSRAM